METAGCGLIWLERRQRGGLGRGDWQQGLRVRDEARQVDFVG